MLNKKIIASLSIAGTGIMMWLCHMSLVHASIGKTRVRIGFLLGVNRLHYFILGIKIIAAILILIGLVMVAIHARNATGTNKEENNS